MFTIRGTRVNIVTLYGPVERDDIDTGATDGKHLFYNPKWFGKLSDLERIGFLAHEVMHVVFMHHLRRQERHAEKWNVATFHFSAWRSCLRR